MATHCAHAANATCPASELRPVPDKVSDEDAAFNTLAEVVMNAMRRARVVWGESIAVVGLGLLGSLTARICAHAGAYRVFGIELSEKRLGCLPKGPAFHALRGEVGDLRQALLRRNDGRLADVVFEATGNPDVIPQELILLRPQGRFVILSSPSGPSQYDFHDLCNRESFTIIGAHYFSHPAAATPDNPWTAVRHSEIFQDCLASGHVAVGDLITHRFSYERASEAYDLLTNSRDEAMGVILEWS